MKCALVVLLFSLYCINNSIAASSEPNALPKNKQSTNNSSQIQDGDCEGIPLGSAPAATCINKRVLELDQQLNNVYRLAMEKLTEQGEQDIRKERGQLRKSQHAWSTYVDENCSLVGGLDGGFMAQSITHTSLLCRAHELQMRIQFLKRIVNEVQH